MRIVPRLPFADWAKKAESGEMTEVRRMCDVLAETMRPTEETLNLLALDAMLYGVAITITDPDGTVRRIPPPEAIR